MQRAGLTDQAQKLALDKMVDRFGDVVQAFFVDRLPAELRQMAGLAGDPPASRRTVSESFPSESPARAIAARFRRDDRQ